MKRTSRISQSFLITFIFATAGFLAIMPGCKVQPTDPVEVSPTPLPAAQALSWDSKPVLKAASGDMQLLLAKDLDTYSKASDITKICPKWPTLSKDQQTKAIAEFWVSTAVHESSWNPESKSVDVGKPELKDTWSVGLWQMSVVDQKNYGFDFGFDFAALQTPLPNAKLAFAVMKNQITKRGKIMIPQGEPGIYWAVLRPGGKYDHSAEIITRTQKQAPFCK